MAGETVCALKGVEGWKFEDGVHAGADGPSGARPLIKKGRLAPLHESTAHDGDEGGFRIGFFDDIDHGGMTGMKRIPLGCDADEGRGGRHGDSLFRNCKILRRQTSGFRRQMADVRHKAPDI